MQNLHSIKVGIPAEVCNNFYFLKDKIPFILCSKWKHFKLQILILDICRKCTENTALKRPGTEGIGTLSGKKYDIVWEFFPTWGGVLPNPKTFVNSPSIFLYAKFILRC